MSDQPTARVETPLHYYREAFAGRDGDVTFAECPPKAVVNLRGNPGNAEFVTGVEKVMGIPLPVQPCTCAVSEEGAIYWQGPDEWLLITDRDDAQTLEKSLRETLGGHVSVVDVSGGLTVLNINGEGVHELLSKSSVYDFHPRSFGPGRCVQTSLAKAGATISQRDNGSFDLVIRRSFADYIARWLLAA